MKIATTLLVALGAVNISAAPQEIGGHRKLNELASFPIQTFFIPLQEEVIFSKMFFVVNSNRARAPIESVVSLAFSTDNTVVWYDHWEDGYDIDVTNETSSTTEIWGDGNATNGCAPIKGLSCTDATDILKAGQAIVVQNSVPLPRTSKILYDGGDRMQTSFPVTATRGAYPTVPGPLMAGAVDIVDTSNWGTFFEAPVGLDVGKTYNVFQYCGLFFMAAFDGTNVTLPDKSIITLNRGESSMVVVNQGDTLNSTDIIQVHLITGDIESYYEMRWYSILPTESWSNEYVTPVGDTVANTKLFLYNPGNTKLTVSWDYLVNGTKTTLSKIVNKRGAALSDVIPTDSGARVYASSNFLALSLTDSEYRTSTGQATAGEWYDWGFALLPRNILTPQVLVGWGYACTNNNCMGNKDRSVVWITPLEDCDIYIDYANKGVNRTMFPRKALSSSKFTDKDQDMSGALIFATKPGTGVTGPTVDIAAAWGQDASVSKALQSLSMDLGTVIRPFPRVYASKVVDKAEVSPGETLTYTIKMLNSGQTDLPAKSMTVYDTLDAMVSYVPNSASIAYAVDKKVISTPVADDTSGTAFPFDGIGYVVRNAIARRGGAIDITFNVTLDRPITGSQVINQGTIKQPLGSPLPFSASSNIVFKPSISIDNKVYIGADNEKLCGTAVDYVEDFIGADVTYCFNVTNTGDTYLVVAIVDSELSYQNASIGLVSPGSWVMVSFTSKISKALLNNATVTATPAYSTGLVIDGSANVTASDPSKVGIIVAAPSISIDNTVSLASDLKCGTDAAVEYVENFKSAAVTYCFNVTNTGNTNLSNVVIEDKELGIYDSSIGDLDPGENVMIAVSSVIDRALVNNATVSANPVFKNGKDIPGLKDTTDSDPSAVGILIFTPSLSVENKVYTGSDGGQGCGTDAAEDSVEAYYGSDVTYCFKVTNTGNTSLKDVILSNPLLDYNKTFEVMAPGETEMVPLPAAIDGDLKNYVNVTATPILEDGTILPVEPIHGIDDSVVVEIKFSPQVTIENTVYAGRDQNLCVTDKPSKEAKGNNGDDVIFCFKVTNTGDSYLDNIVVSDALSSTRLPLDQPLAPGQSSLLTSPFSINGGLLNMAEVSANPVTSEGVDVPGLADVTASDSSEVVEIVQTASISIENKVYAGSDIGASCSTAGLEEVSGGNLAPVVYCFKVTNTGETFLRIESVEDSDLSFSNSSIGLLEPGTSKTVTFMSLISGTRKNNAVVIATPVTAAGNDIATLKTVSASDGSSVILVVDSGNTGDPRKGDKDLYRAPNNNPDTPASCMENAYNDATNQMYDLVCTSSDVFLENADSNATLTCVAGETITITVDASIHFASARYDLGWYVATDGGDALDGTCVVNGLQERNAYNVVDGPGSDKVVGSVKWDSDVIDNADACGDIFTNTAGAGGNIDIPIIVGLPVVCADENDDGKLDVAICFTWRNAQTDSSCTIDVNDPLTAGTRADMYPGEEKGCFCERIDLAKVTVVARLTDNVAPC